MTGPILKADEWGMQAPAMVGKFKAAVRPISIAEFRNFVLSGNPYSSEALWDPEDFAVIKAAHQQCPSTWTVTVSLPSILPGYPNAYTSPCPIKHSSQPDTKLFRFAGRLDAKALPKQVPICARNPNLAFENE